MTGTLLPPEVDVAALARHETAHGVAARVAGIRITECRLSTSLTGSLLGGETYIDEYGIALAGRWSGFAVVLFAGLIAQLRYLDQVGHLTTRVQTVLEERNVGDWEEWLLIRRRCPISESTARHRATTLVDQQWSRIDQSGGTLADRGRLAGARL